MKSEAKVIITLGQVDFITLKRFFNRGVRCADENHDRYSSSVYTYGCDSVTKALKRASDELAIVKATELINND